MKRLIFALLFFFFSAGCSQTEPKQFIPNPAIRIETQTPAFQNVGENSPTDLPMSTVTPITETLAQLMETQYGKRLIDYIEIPALGLRAPVKAMGWDEIDWDSPDAAVGWASNSTLPDQPNGNIILYGHNNINSSVFRNLADLKPGDLISVQTGDQTWKYQVDSLEILPVQNDQEESEAYAAYFKQTYAPRLTLISCWPPTNNTHRVIVVSYPVMK
jgi:LPXTG-site transpeptidase (sortase) family protein